jgi:hypothetical protein
LEEEPALAGEQLEQESAGAEVPAAVLVLLVGAGQLVREERQVRRVREVPFPLHESRTNLRVPMVCFDPLA